jgi:hypothetical protein
VGAWCMYDHDTVHIHVGSSSHMQIRLKAQYMSLMLTALGCTIFMVTFRDLQPLSYMVIL